MKNKHKKIRAVLTAIFLCISLIGTGAPEATVLAAGNTGSNTSYIWVKQKATKKTKKTTKKKTVKLKKAARKSYSTTKTKKSSKSSSKVKGNTKTVTKVDTTVKTTTKYKKGSKKATSTIVTTTVTTKTPYKKKAVVSENKDTSTAGNTAEKKETNKDYASSYIRTLAPKADACVLDAFIEMGIRIYIRPDAYYSGYFDAGTRSVTLKRENNTIYHELGHFAAWMAGNVDRSQAFNSIYQEEKDKFTGFNKIYLTQNSSEFFAGCYSEYILNNASLKAQCPKTYVYIQESIGKITPPRVANLKTAYVKYWESIGY